MLNIFIYIRKNLFSYIVNDLSGISFSEVDFEWGLLATDLNHEVKALNSPINFTVIDTTFSNGTNALQAVPYSSSSGQEINYNFFGAE